MSFRLYIVPIVRNTRNERVPKYFGDGQTTVASDWSGMDYGLEDWMVVGGDLTVTEDAAVVGMPDAFAVPFDLSAALTSPQVTAVQNKLEAINVPAGWVNTSLKWIEVVRSVLGMFTLMQRYHGLHGGNGVFTGGVALSTTIGALPVAVRNDFTAAAVSLGLNVSGITGTTTLRQALKALADQLSQMAYHFGTVTL